MNNEERKMLECAAKVAAPKGDHSWSYSFNRIEVFQDGIYQGGWNPLTSDADAFRLMCKALLVPVFYSQEVSVCGDVEGSQAFAKYDEHGGSIANATRHAITLAAARLGGYEG